ncbi:MAG: reverse transcriptase family protein [Planctomycetota bacterium]
MGLFDAIKKLLGLGPTTPTHLGGRRPAECPACGFSYRWDGRNCGHCGYPGPTRLRQGGSAPSGPDSRTTQALSDLSDPTPSPAGPPQTQALSGLDADKFKPMTADEAMSTIRSAGNIRSAYWDSLNVIPDASLPRIQVIDRTMVGLGLISGPELEHIHDVGRQMEELRGDRSSISRQADAAVARSRQERAELRRQKKEEATRRKQAHAEAVARRRATDIVYLGRGVSRGLSDRRSNVEKLEAMGLPVLSSPADLSAAMGVSIPRLRFLAFHSEAPTRVHYVYFTVPKKSGGQRVLSAPHKGLATAQQWVLDNILRKLPTHDAAHGFVPGRSTVTNASQHVGKAVVVNADLSDFFPTITFPRIKGLLQSLGYSPAVATTLALLCTECPRRPVSYGGQVYYAATGPRALPQGACTSPAFSNAVARRLDCRLTGIAHKLGWTYTRYADDLTFSGTNEQANNAGYLLARLRHITQDEGFAVNEKKTRIQRRNTRQSVTGLVVNDGVAVPRPTVRRIRSILHRAQHEGLPAQNRDERPYFEAWLSGMIAYVEMANPAQGQPLRAAYRQIVNGS